ncbi:hypothetical protein FOS14_16970 [Skermania sp. ID1734]|uniref:hypothetical protein n=1 Tax=Skermania sp. ID1734 TaxID=2597516 RepID=UPI00117D2B93|nr:hypothetical protein [Skermania sp. ID1734]TSD96055.1 hypothetical protein FOS14_16970 [Skermania sp. ID1734]
MPLTRAQMWKLAGLASVVTVAATGVMVARDERRRRAYSPDEVREQLHARYARVASAGPDAGPKHARRDGFGLRSRFRRTQRPWARS